MEQAAKSAHTKKKKTSEKKNKRNICGFHPARLASSKPWDPKLIWEHIIYILELWLSACTHVITPLAEQRQWWFSLRKRVNYGLWGFWVMFGGSAKLHLTFRQHGGEQIMAEFYDWSSAHSSAFYRRATAFHHRVNMTECFWLAGSEAADKWAAECEAWMKQLMPVG